jgi:hypothetical protein
MRFIMVLIAPIRYAFIYKTRIACGFGLSTIAKNQFYKLISINNFRCTDLVFQNH